MIKRIAYLTDGEDKSGYISSIINEDSPDEYSVVGVNFYRTDETLARSLMKVINSSDFVICDIQYGKSDIIYLSGFLAGLRKNMLLMCDRGAQLPYILESSDVVYYSHLSLHNEVIRIREILSESKNIKKASKLLKLSPLDYRSIRSQYFELGDISRIYIYDDRQRRAFADKWICEAISSVAGLSIKKSSGYRNMINYDYIVVNKSEDPDIRQLGSIISLVIQSNPISAYNSEIAKDKRSRFYQAIDMGFSSVLYFTYDFDGSILEFDDLKDMSKNSGIDIIQFSRSDLVNVTNSTEFEDLLKLKIRRLKL